MGRHDVIDHDDYVTRFQNLAVGLEINSLGAIEVGADACSLNWLERQIEHELAVGVGSRLHSAAIAFRLATNRQMGEPHQHVGDVGVPASTDDLSSKGVLDHFLSHPDQDSSDANGSHLRATA